MSESPSHQRSKRQKIDRVGRFAALEKLKSLKGQKNKYEVNGEVDNVYDVVDEKEFAKKVGEKYGQDWIEDDGTGYLEDGRDFFEDEDECLQEKSAHEGKSKNSKKRSRESEVPIKGRGSIRSLFSNTLPKKKKEAEAKLEEDDVLADILDEIDNKNNSKTHIEKEPNAHTNKDLLIDKNQAGVVKDYVQSFINNIKKKDVPESNQGNKTDDEMIIRNFNPKTDILRKEKVINTDQEIPPCKIEVEQSNTTGEKKLHTEKKENLINVAGSSSDTDLNLLIEDENHFIEIPTATEEKSKAYFKSGTATDNTEMLLSNWDNICKMDNFDEELTAPNDSQESTPNDGSLKMWYWDAWEDYYKRPGQVFLFGKVKVGADYKSVCAHIGKIEKVLYLLPREYMLDSITKEPLKDKVTFLDVYKEFNDTISMELGLTSFRSRKVTKNFAFNVPGVDVPETCEYLEIRYEGKYPAPNIKKIYHSIAHIFGTNTSALETFLLERKIKGPCWLNLSNYKLNESLISWCKLEVICSSANSVNVAEEQNSYPPPMVVLAINVRTALNSKAMKNEVVMVSCLVNNKFRVDKPPPNPPFNRHFCGFTRPTIQNWPLDLGQKLKHYTSTKATKLDTERALLCWFLATYQSIDPDLIVTHDGNDCQLDVVCERITAIKIPMWSRIGRLKMTHITGKKFKDFFIGRMICDVKQSAEELIKSRSYDLDTLCMNVLKLKEGERLEVSNDDLYTMYETADGLLKLITLTMQDCSYILKLMCELNVLPLALQITNICGNLMSRTLQGGRSERNEYLLLHAFAEKNYIVPDKKMRMLNWDNPETNTQMNQTTHGRKKAAYSGGLVLEPVKGFYDKYILLMDFNSLYPSIIQEYNICFTTISEPDEEHKIPVLPDSNVEQGVLPRQIRRLVESRREVKKLMANSDLDVDQKMQYNIRQLALKLTANSMYGCLGFANSRFFAQHLAALVTHKGREILMNTKSLVQKLNFDVIYGDTDSIMINTNCTEYDQVFKIGHNIKQTVNKIYRQIELDIDGVFKYLLLLKKKKYAAVIISKNNQGEIVETKEFKGLDIVRRDWSQISVMAGKVVLDEILSDNQLDEKVENIHVHLEKFKQNILDGSVPTPMLAVTKQLTKAPKDYTSITMLPHVQVALRMNSTRNKRYKKGDMVSFIICEDGTNNPPMQRAYHLEELKNNEKLIVDTTYYLAQQIHPVVSRLCEPLEGTDASRIAACLGLDPKKFKIAAQKIQRERMEEGAGVSFVKTTLEKYRHCEKFKFICVSCKTANVIASAFKPMDKSHVGVLQKCSNNECNSLPYQYVTSIRNELVLSIRAFIRRFYENWMVCDDPACNSNTRIYSHVAFNNRPICLSCKQGVLIRQYSEKDLFNQLSYYQYMFDLGKHEQKDVCLSAEVEGAYNMLKETVDIQLENSGYCTVSLSIIFENLFALAT